MHEWKRCDGTDCLPTEKRLLSGRRGVSVHACSASLIREGEKQQGGFVPAFAYKGFPLLFCHDAVAGNHLIINAVEMIAESARLKSAAGKKAF